MTNHTDLEITKELENMLVQENDPASRGTLLFLLKLSNMIDSRTREHRAVTSELAKQSLDTADKLASLSSAFDTHKDEIDGKESFRAGIWKTLAVVWIVVQGTFGYLGSTLYEEHGKNTHAIIRLEERVDKLIVLPNVTR